MKPTYEELEKQLAQLKMTFDAIRSTKVDNILGTDLILSVQPTKIHEALQNSCVILQKLLDNAENIIHHIRNGKVDNVIGFEDMFTVELKNTHDAFVEAHHELTEGTTDLVAANTALQKEITERKQAEKELKEKKDSLEIFSKLAINRELKMVELKKEINQLLVTAGENPRYKIAS